MKTIAPTLLLFVLNIWMTSSIYAQGNCNADTSLIFTGETITLNEILYFYEDHHNYDIEDVAAPDFQPNFKLVTPKDTLKNGKIYWLKFSLQNQYNPYPYQDRYYFFTPSISKRLQLYTQLPDSSSFLRLESSIKNHFAHKTENSRLNILTNISHSGFELPMSAENCWTFYVRFECIGNPIPFNTKYAQLYHIATLEEVYTYARGHIQYFFYGGSLLGIIAFSIGLFFFLREVSLIYYITFCISMLIYNTYNSNILSVFYPDLFMQFPKVYYGLLLTSHSAIFSFLLFTRTYLNLKKYLPIWNRLLAIIGWITVVCLIYELYVLITDYEYPLKWFLGRLNRLFSLVIPSVICLLISLFFIKNIPIKRKYFFILGVLSIATATLLMGLVFLIKKEIPTISHPFFIIFSSLEFIFFALGFAYRIKENEVEKKHALIQLKETETENQTNILKRQNLEELTQFKNHFYTNITHEFRTPLTVINGTVEHINGKYHQEKEIILRNSHNLLYLVNQMLDLSKLESGTLELHLQKSNILAFIRTEIHNYINLASSKDIQIHFQSNTESIEMDFDRHKVQQIIANLLSNALKFVPESGSIQVFAKKTLQKDLPYLELSIQDNGIGITQDKLPYIFDRYYQAHVPEYITTQGSGIGLALTKELVELMNGTITVQSQVHKGTQFTILLPITTKAPSFNDDTILHTKETSNISHLPLVKDIDQPVVLIVEDNQDIIRILTKHLQNQYRILTAHNGQEGLAVAQNKIPDIIISDIMMPLMDGYMLTHQLKTDERTSHIPIILLTAKADQSSKVQGLNKGADAYLSKPFDKKELSVRLEKLIALRKTLQNKFQKTPSLSTITNTSVSGEDVFLHRIYEYIQQNLDDSSYSIDQLAKDMLLSRQQLFRKVKALTGSSISVYVRNIRLHFGKAMLQNTDLSVSEVAYKVGFSSASYFSKCFTEAFGYSPNQEK